MAVADASRTGTGLRSIAKARRSTSAASGASPSSPSSSRTRPKRAADSIDIPSRSALTSPSSSAPARCAAIDGDRRSAIGTAMTPPSALARSPRVMAGFPCASVALRSRPPRTCASSIVAGILRMSVPRGRAAANVASHASRTGPYGARRTTPPSSCGATARRAAMRSARRQGSVASVLVGTGVTLSQKVRRLRARRGRWRGSRRADCAEADAARPWAQRCADAHPRSRGALRKPRGRERRASA